MADPLIPRLARGARIASLACLGLGFVGGVIDDPTPARPETHRAGYRVLEGDFHVHTAFSDGSLTPIGVVRQAERRGLDVIALTEHNSVLPGLFARSWSRLIYSQRERGPIVLSGQEVTTSRFHMIAIGITTTISPNQSAEGVVRDIHAQGGIAIAAHPVPRFWPALLPVRQALDGAEVMHPLAYSAGPRAPGWRWPDMVRFYDEASPRLAPIGSSDYHWGSILGLCRTYVFVNEPVSEEAILEALRARRTVVADLEGRLYGDPALTEAIAKEPIAPRDADYRYAGRGPRDRVLRTLGWLGLLGIVVFGRGRRRATSASDAGHGRGRGS